MKKVLLSLICLVPYAMQGMENDQVFPMVETEQDIQYEQLQVVKQIAKTAGKKILELKNSSSLQGEEISLANGKKMRQTRADLEADQYIRDELASAFPGSGLISQDHMDQDPDWYAKESVWIINAIDGTKQFENNDPDFHVQIGLLERDVPVLGLSYYPVTDTYVWAIQGKGAWIEQDGTIKKLVAKPSEEKILLKSSNHQAVELYLQEKGWVISQVIDVPLSSTTRLLKLIQGEAACYISFGAFLQGKEKKGGIWNYGANSVIADEAGLGLTTLQGQPLNLREKSALLVNGVVATNNSLEK